MTKRAMRGVNLGGWLVLEPWITPALFEATGAVDEYTFCDLADTKERLRRLKALRRHRETFITEEDFQWLARQGIEAVRIPVGHWVFGEAAPYEPTAGYLDKAFGWAEKYHIKVLVCLHGLPGSQNGTMHSGRLGRVDWPVQPANLERSLAVISRLATRYASSPALLGLEVINEPAQEIPRWMLLRYYYRCYRIIRRHLGPQAWMVISDRFKPGRWWWVMAWPLRRQVYLDSHQYQIFTPADRALDVAGHLAKTRRVGRALRLIGRCRRLIIGEWSLALDAASLDGLEAEPLQAAYRRYAEAQLQAYGQADAWFYWTYRTGNGGPWSYREMVEKHILPSVKL